MLYRKFNTMKIIKLHRIYLLFFIASGLILNSCSENSGPGTTKNKFFISGELKTEITSQQVIANFTSISPDAAPIGLFIKSDVEVHKVTYKTIFQNKNILASGLVCFPKIEGNFPILSFQNGTNTLHSMAPTEAYADSLYSLLESVASMGFIVVIPDYIGFGASVQIPHPYLDAKSTTQSILDMIRAAKEFGADDKILAKPTDDLFIFGYSQGGWATLKLQQEIENNYSSEFNLIASSCGAGPYSLEYISKYVTSQETYSNPYFLAYLLNSYHETGAIKNPMTDFFNEPYADTISYLFDGKHTGGEINAALNDTMEILLTPEFRNEYATNPKFTDIKSAFLANSIKEWNISTPTHLYHGSEDEVIPISMSSKMLSDFKTIGVPDTKIQMITIPGASHTTGVFQAGLQTTLWFLSLKK